MYSEKNSNCGGNEVNDPRKQSDYQDQDDVEELIIGHFEGSLNADQEKRLSAAIAGSVESKRLFLSHMRMEGRLHSLGRDGFLRIPDDGVFTTTDEEIEAPIAVGSKPVQRPHWRFLKVIGALAAGILLMFFLSNIIAPSNVNANTVLARAQQAAAELVDRTYHFVFTDLSNPDKPVKKEFDIDLRGGGLFVIRPNEDPYIMGSDGEMYWMARKKRGPVAVTPDYKTLAPALQRRIPNRRLVDVLASQNEPLLLDLSSFLSLIKRAYEIELIDSEDDTLNHIRATVRANRPARLPTIDLFADAESGVIVKIEATRTGISHALFELQESVPRSENWYHHESHFTRRPVVQLPSESP